MEKHNFVTIADLNKDDLMYLIQMAHEFEQHPDRELLKGKVIATLFYEPSTRTRLSFETAANRLGARVIGFSDAKASSVSKGETLKDTILMVSNYADTIVMRHYIEGAAQYASEVAPVPIVNAGDGAHMHPSQCLLDLYTIYQTQGTLDNLNIYLVGDLKYGRTVHSLIMAMRHFNPTFHFIAPKELAKHAKANMRIWHPLPRVNEIAYDVDDDPHAYYIQQARNGLYAREAIFCHCLGISLEDIKNDNTIIKSKF